MHNRNSKEALHKWVEEILTHSHLNKSMKELLKREGVKLINEGKWRGDISDAWREWAQVDIISVPDLYV